MPDDEGVPGDVPVPSEDAPWIRPDESGVTPVSPPGVRYGSRPTGSPPVDHYQELRTGESDRALPLEDPNQPYAPPPRRSFGPFLIGVLLGAALAAVSILGFQLLSGDEGDPVTAPDTTAPATTTSTTSPAETSLPVETTTSTTTAPEDTGVDTTTTSPPDAPPVEPVGNPLAIDDMRLGADGIGPITIGLPADQALGRLVASLGEPDEDTGYIAADGSYGDCPGTTVRVMRWGPLAAVVVADDEGERFSSYRLDLAYGGLDSRAAAMATLSGLRAGDSVADLEDIYADFVVEIVDEPGTGLVFKIRRQQDSGVLLWGPVTTAAEDGRVTGIYAPDTCEA